MRGIDFATRQIALALQAHYPARIALLATENGPCVNQVDPTPKMIHWTMVPRDTVKVQSWPFVLVVPQRTPTIELIDRDTDDLAAKVYNVTQQVRIFCWVKGRGYDETTSVRNRLTLATTEVLLAYPELGDGLKFGGGLTEEYSDVMTDPQLQQSVGASYLDFMVNSQETVTPALPPYGPVDSTDATIEVVQPNEAPFVPFRRPFPRPQPEPELADLIREDLAAASSDTPQED